MLYKEKIKQTNEFKGTLKEYLQESINSHKDKSSLCIGWDFLKTNLTQELKDILLNPNYQKIVYNDENIKFILNELGVNLEEHLTKQLGSFVYVWKDIKRDLEKQNQESELKERLLKEGFKEGEFMKLKDDETIEELDKRRKEYGKKLDGLKVMCVMDLNRIGLMGSFDETKELQGTFRFSEHNNSLMLLPKRSRTRGHLIRGRFYYKELQGGKK